MATDTLPLSALSRHLEAQVRGRTEDATVNRYRQAMRSGETFPPLLIADVGGALILVDGFHRRAALEALGVEEAVVEVVRCGSLQEALWLGFNANLRHGQPLRPRLLRQAFNAYVKAGRHRKGSRGFKSYREIAADIAGVSYSAVRRWMQADFPAVFRAMGEPSGGAAGGLSENAKPEAALMREALALIDDAAALMGGVGCPRRKERVAAHMKAAAAVLDLDGHSETTNNFNLF